MTKLNVIKGQSVPPNKVNWEGAGKVSLIIYFVPEAINKMCKQKGTRKLCGDVRWKKERIDKKLFSVSISLF